MTKFAPSSWIARDYAEYLMHFRQVQRDGGLPPWYEPLDYDTWLSRQTLKYLRGEAAPIHPVS